MTLAQRQFLAAVVFSAFVTAIAIILSGCTATFPLGEQGRFGSIVGTVNYQLPIDWRARTDFLPEK